MSALRALSPAHMHDTTLTAESLSQFDYAVINPLVVHERDWRDLPVQALETSPAPARAHRLPQLVDFAALPASKHGDLVSRTKRYRRRGVALFSALISSDKRFDDTALHLRRQLLQRRPGDRRYHWLRYYDPRVFRHMLWLLTPEQLSRLMGPISLWSWPDTRGQWHAIEQPNEASVIDWLELNRQQWASIDRFAALNMSLRRLAAVAPSWPQDMAHWQWLDDVMRQVHDNFGLSIEDQQSLAESAAAHHPNLIEHPTIRDLLTQASQSSPSAAHRLRQIDASAWNIIISDLKERA